MKLLGKEYSFKFDAYDADDLARLEKAEKELEKADSVMPKTTAEYRKWLISNCRAIQAFFAELFGDGADAKIFGDKTNLVLCVDSIMDFYDDVGLQGQKIKAKYEKYSLNRAERRK